MLLIIAFACFALLFTAWLLAPTSAPGAARAPQAAPMSGVPETGTSPA